MAKRKLSPIFTPNSLDFMVEYMLVSSILERICDMTKEPLEYPRSNTRLDPLMHLLEIKTWGKKWKRVINKKEEWVAWWWLNVKMDKESFFIIRQIENTQGHANGGGELLVTCISQTSKVRMVGQASTKQQQRAHLLYGQTRTWSEINSTCTSWTTQSQCTPSN